MMPTKTPSETLELACRLAEQMNKRVSKIARLATMAVGQIESGAVTYAPAVALTLLGSEADGLGKDVRDLTEVLSRLPVPDQGGRNG